MIGYPGTRLHKWIYLVGADCSIFDLPMLSVYPDVVISCAMLYTVAEVKLLRLQKNLGLDRTDLDIPH